MSAIQQIEFSAKDNTKVIIRTAEVSDASSIIEVMMGVMKDTEFTIHEQDEYPDTIESKSEQIKKYKNALGKLFLVAEVNGSVVGFLTFNNWDTRRTSHCGFLSMFIKSGFRGKGIGKVMLSLLIEWAELNPEIEKLCLAVFSNNHSAIKLYKQMGFAEEGRCAKEMKLNGNYVDSVLMYRFV